MDRINTSNNNPTLHYRLDPGEPGILRSAKASESGMAVTAQEMHNIARLKADAMREGRRVIYAGIKYSAGVEGNFVALHAGLTTVISKPAPETIGALVDMITMRQQEPQAEGEAPALEAAEPVQEDSEEGAIGAIAKPADEPPKPEELRQSQNILRSEKTNLEAKARNAERMAANTPAPAVQGNAETETKDIERRIERIDREIKRIELEKMMQQMDTVQKNTNDAMKAMDNQAGNLVSRMPEKGSQNPALYKRAGMPRFSNPGQVINHFI